MRGCLLAAVAAVMGWAGAAWAQPAPAALAAMAFDDAPFKAGEYKARVTRIVDGDTMWAVLEGRSKPIKVRIEGIDAPEVCQDFGQEAKQALTSKLLNRDVTLKLRALDSWGRRLGQVFDGDTNVGQRMVRDGMAWSYRYRWDRGPYIADERLAQALNRGIHGRDGAVEPREFRRVHGGCANGEPPKELPETTKPR